MIPGDLGTLLVATTSPGAEAEAGVGARSTAVCPRCDREQTINTAATALTELHYCLVCRQSFLISQSSTERAVEAPGIGGQDFSSQARHPAVPAPQPFDLRSSQTGSCHWFWQYPGVVVGGLFLASMLLYAWRSL